MGRAGVALPVVLLLLAGCSETASVNPVDWWHNLEGGEIADQRPPPPKADAPYPNLSTVPARPNVTPPGQRQAVVAGLVADRADARVAAEQAPIAPPAPAAAPPPPPPAMASASLPAASAPPSAPAPAAPPPVAAPVSPAPVASTPVASAPIASASASPASMPEAPPPPPRLAGVPRVTMPTPPPKAPPPPPAPPAAVIAGPGRVTMNFSAGATDLPAGAEEALKLLVSRHRAQQLVVSAGGDGEENLASQAAALPLALARARAIAAMLMADGVPSSMIGINASAGGHSGAVRIIN